MSHINLTAQGQMHTSHHTQLNSKTLTPSLSHKQNQTTANTTMNTPNQKQDNQNISTQTQEELQKQIKKLNESIGPLSTFIKFGVDKNNVFFVAVIDKKNDEVLSRFPAAKAENIIQKLKEPIGIIFDTKG